MTDIIERLRAGPIVHAVTDLAPTQILMEEAADTIQSLQARVKVLEGAGWQPIETAPKDGGDILLTYGDSGYFVGRPNGDGTFDDGDWNDHASGFTHWMPLPAPPARSTLQGEGGE